jgi:membrane fusion protein (multidrug efflux system)
MSLAFSRTIRSLESGRCRRPLLWLLTAALLSAWAAWFVCGRVRVCEVTEKARLEVPAAAHAIQAPVAGQVVETRLTIGQEVHEGDVLIRLDTEPERLVIQEQQAHREGLAARLLALRKEIEAEHEAMSAHRQARLAAIEETRRQIPEAEARADYAQTHAELEAVLLQKNAASADEYKKARAEALATRALVTALRAVPLRVEKDRLAQEADHKIRLAKLQREAAELEGDIKTGDRALRKLQQEVERRTIRAPVSGRVGEAAAEFRVGSFVQAGARLGVIVPVGEPRAVAFFSAAAVGRIQPGQAARLRLDGFPWTQYGTVAATVADVGNEATGGLIRVQFNLSRQLPLAIPIEHGLPGTAEVEIEQVSPAVLVLRAAGQLLPAKPALTSRPPELTQR